MEYLEKLKVVVVLAFTVLSGWLGILAIPVLLLFVLASFDYVTGLMAAKYRGDKVSSYKGFRGIMKKVCLFYLIAVGAILDYTLLYASQYIGVDAHVNFVIASFVAVWLICNEIISILENMKDMNVKFPAFLEKLTQNIRTQMENETGAQTIDENEDGEDNTK
ncbi:phage holin family protein [Acetobacterium sp. KB-1]|jgi:toxin secretion/phage lysis holin|uniref:phage holin family protein n=1 Tax=Acetobacterium sp. KB-1 TaxID=2184575 RepID=UPI000DBEC70E|nr:phage holin family protein [Acetobacterium sp. KB-1]AWW25939.1 holin [Acetobacterium sp. KB-1]